MSRKTVGVYRYFLKPLLFLLPPEDAHYFALALLKIAIKIPGVERLIRSAYCMTSAKLKQNVLGLTFTNPVGLAAGFDKNAKYIREMAALGFGFVEVGTITPLPQPGNEKPRLFRLTKDRALINRMGFNNDGVDAIVNRLKRTKRPAGLVVGGNIGKNKVTSNENAVKNYEICFNKLFDYVDYFVVNVSSPNTPGLRELQEKEPLLKILTGLQQINHAKHAPKPILLKIAPDLTNEQLDDVVDIVKQSGIAGIIATNTTIERKNLAASPDVLNKIGNGGLSGAVLKERSTEVIRYLSQKSSGSFTVIGAGGIMNGDDALEKIKAGASLVQIYTGFIYEGPSLARSVCKRLLSA